MLRASMFFQMCSVSCGVFGFGGGAAPSWFVAKGLFFLFLILALALLAGGTISRPAHWNALGHKLGA